MQYISSLNIECDSEFVSECDGLKDPVEKAIQKFKNHPSIISIEENIVSLEIFKFHKINLDDILKELSNLDMGLKIELWGTFLLNA